MDPTANRNSLVEGNNRYHDALQGNKEQSVWIWTRSSPMLINAVLVIIHTLASLVHTVLSFCPLCSPSLIVLFPLQLSAVTNSFDIFADSETKLVKPYLFECLTFFALQTLEVRNIYLIKDEGRKRCPYIF